MDAFRRDLVLGGVFSLAAFALTSKAIAAPPPPIQAILVRDDGIIIHEELADKRRHPASLTKMLTLLTVMRAMKEFPDKLAPDTKIDMPKIRAGLTHGVVSTLGANKNYRLGDLMVAAGARSCARSSLALAVHTGRLLCGEADEQNCHDRFITQMNRIAGSIGMEDSCFLNPIGTPDARHYSTASDMARLLKALHGEFPDLSRAAMGRSRFTIDGKGRSATKGLREYLDNRSAHVAFGKTGTTNEAGRCFAAVTNVNEKPHYFVLIGAGQTPQIEQKFYAMRKEAMEAQEKGAKVLFPAHKFNFG